MYITNLDPAIETAGIRRQLDTVVTKLPQQDAIHNKGFSRLPLQRLRSGYIDLPSTAGRASEVNGPHEQRLVSNEPLPTVPKLFDGFDANEVYFT